MAGAKKPIKKKTTTYQRAQNVARQKKLAQAAKKRTAKLKGRKQSRAQRHKAKLYRGLLRDYIAKQNEHQNGKKKKLITYREAQSSKKFKKVMEDLKSPDPFIKLSALKQTTRRDNVPDSIVVGETPVAFTA